MFTTIDFSNPGALEMMIMQSNMECNNLIEQMREAYLEGEEDVELPDISHFTDNDKLRIENTYEELFGD